MISRKTSSSAHVTSPDSKLARNRQAGSPQVNTSHFDTAMQRARAGIEAEYLDGRVDSQIGYSTQLSAEMHLLDYRVHATATLENRLETTALIDAVNRYAAGQDVDTKALLLVVTGQNWPVDAIRLHKSSTGAIQLTLAVTTEKRYEKLLRSSKDLSVRLAELHNVSLDLVILDASHRSLSESLSE